MLLSAQLGTLYVWRHMWVEFVVGSLLCSERIFSGYSGFPLSSKTNISKFQLAWISSDYFESLLGENDSKQSDEFQAKFQFDQDQVDKEPLCGSATSKSLLIYSFIYLFIYTFVMFSICSPQTRPSIFLWWTSRLLTIEPGYRTTPDHQIRP